MTQGRVRSCKRTQGLERRIERLNEQLGEAVSEFEDIYPYPASAIFNFIGDSVVPNVTEYDGTDESDTILRWDLFPNPNAESNGKDTDELTEKENKAQQERLNALLAWAKRRR